MEKHKKNGRLVRTIALLLVMAMVATSMAAVAGNGSGGACEGTGQDDASKTQERAREQMQTGECEQDGEQSQERNREQKQSGDGEQSGEQKQEQNREQKQDGECEQAGEMNQEQNREQKQTGECEGDPVLTRAAYRYVNGDGEGPSEDCPMFHYMYRYMHQEQVVRV